MFTFKENLISVGAKIIGRSNCADLMRNTPLQKFNVDGNLRVGVISDTQLPPFKNRIKDDVFYGNLKNALTVFKENNVNLILFAGDIGDLGTKVAFRLYMKAFDEVYGDNKPIVQTIMGNHDYWGKDIFSFIDRKKAFAKIIGHSPWTHYEVNGFHFIGASPDCGNMTNGYQKTSVWLEHELEIANSASPDKPIFVVTHNHPENTCYGSHEWGDIELGKVLEKYPNVVNFSGHTHYSVLDERAVWQGEYTVMNTQSLSYTELEQGKANGTIPPHADITPMGYIVDFKDDSFEVLRMNFAPEYGAQGYEEKKDKRWVFPLPFKNDKRYSFENSSKDNKAPVKTRDGGTAEIADNKIRLTFPAFSDDDFVHSYKIVVDGKDEKLYFSDFYNGIENMSDTVIIELTDLDVDCDHTFTVYGVDSWGAESEDFIKIGFKETKR